MNRISVWFLCSFFVALVFVVNGHLPDKIEWVIAAMIGAASGLFTHWAGNLKKY
jgi:hypothetical protein